MRRKAILLDTADKTLATRRASSIRGGRVDVGLEPFMSGASAFLVVDANRDLVQQRYQEPRTLIDACGAKDWRDGLTRTGA